MKLKTLCGSMMLVFAAGCTSSPPQKAAWDIQPVLSIRHGVHDARGFYQLGRYYQGQNRLEKAEIAYRRAIDADDRFIDAYNALGVMYAEHGELERAVAMFSRVVAMAPESAYLQNNLGYAYLMQGRLAEALAAVRLALVRDPGFERAWNNLGKIAAATSNEQLAEQVRLRQIGTVIAQRPAGKPDDDSVPKPTLIVTDLTNIPRASDPPAAEPARIVEAADPPPHSRLAVGVITPRPEGFIRVSATKEVRPVNGRVELPSPSPVPEAVAIAAPTAMTVPSTTETVTPPRSSSVASTPYRLEVSNGNGVTRFARKFSERLSESGVSVRRITNHKPFTVQTTVIEYQPGYESPALMLMERIGIKTQVIQARQSRPGTDVQIILGRDAIRGGGLQV